MQLDQFFKIEYINANLSARNKSDVLQEMVDTVISGGVGLNGSSAVEVLKKRENLGTTGIGEGVAIPHGKISDLGNITIAFGKSTEGISYDAVDGKPVHLLFMLLAPENTASQHLKILANISRMLKEADFREKLLNTESDRDLYEIILSRSHTRAD